MQYATVESIATVNLACPECREGDACAERIVSVDARGYDRRGISLSMPMRYHQQIACRCVLRGATQEYAGQTHDDLSAIAAVVIASVKAILGKQLSTYSVSTLRFEIHALATTLRLAHKTDYHMQLGDDLHRVADRKAVDML